MPRYIDEVQGYVDYILDNGFEYIDEKKDDVATSYYYSTPNGSDFLLCLAWKYNEVWIYIRG